MTCSCFNCTGDTSREVEILSFSYNSLVKQGNDVVTITVRNNLSKSVNVALCWYEQIGLTCYYNEFIIFAPGETKDVSRKLNKGVGQQKLHYWISYWDEGYLLNWWVCSDSKLVSYEVYSDICSRIVKIAEGQGSVKVYKNDSLISTVTSSQTFTGLASTDILRLEAIPVSGYVFQKWCDQNNSCLGGNPWLLGVECLFGDRTYGAYFSTVTSSKHSCVNYECVPDASGKYNDWTACILDGCTGGGHGPCGEYTCYKCDATKNCVKCTDIADTACTFSTSSCGSGCACISTGYNCMTSQPGYEVDNCNSKRYNPTKCGVGTVKICADNEMPLFGSCQKKTTVYLVGAALFFMMMQ